MLVSGVVAGIVAGVAFGGDWRRLATFTLRWWPLLVVASALRLWTVLEPHADLLIHVAGLVGVGVVAAANARLAGAALIAAGTFANVLVIALNNGMPYDPQVVAAVGAQVPDNRLYVPLTPSTMLPFLGDIIPFGIGRAVYSIGDFFLAFGGFLLPFIWVQPEVDPSKHELRSTNFAFFWLAQVISRFGDPITLVALTFVTYRATESALLTAVAVGVATIPNALLGFFGGAIADAVGPRRSMFWCDVGRVAVIGAIPLLLAFNVPLVFVFGATFISGALGAVFGPARGALVPSLVSRERLSQANSLVYASDRAVEIGGALAGGALVVALGEGAFYVDALTFGLSAILLARVVVREEARSITWARVVRDAREGFDFMRRSTVIWSNTVFSLIAQFANPVVNTLTPVFLVRRFAGGDPVAGAVLYAGSEAAIALGAVVASAVLPRYLSRVRKGRALIAGFASTGIVIVLIAVAPSFQVALALFALLGLTNVLFFVPTVTILQEATPQHLIARVFGARIALTNLSWLPIIFLGGVVADTIGVDVFIALAGAVTLCAALGATLVPAVRDVA